MYRLILLISFLFAFQLFCQTQNNELSPYQFIPTPHQIELEKISDKSFYQKKDEWQKIIDTTWGKGLALSEKQNIFNTYVKALDKEFPLFSNLSFNWDSLKTHYYNQIDARTSRGRFAAIMSHLAYKLRDVHTYARDTDVLYNPLNPGIPILIVGSNDGNHFGAVLTVGQDSSIIVLKVVNNHPLNIEPGDIILGYEGVPWTDLVEELLDAELPIAGFWGGCKSAYYDAKLISAGMNWHLFESIDIKKQLTNEVISLSLSEMSSLPSDEVYPFSNEQLDIPNIPFPTHDGHKGSTVSYGILQNSNIGFIYLVAEKLNQSDYELQAAMNYLKETDGLIIDLRNNSGGSIHVTFNKAFNLLFNENINTFSSVSRCSPTSWELCFNGLINKFNITADDKYFYQKPIAVLVGPGCGSMGDIIVNRLLYHPNVRLFGKPTMGSPSFSRVVNEFDGWTIKYATSDMRSIKDPEFLLCQKEIPIDYPVWFNTTDVAKGYDTVLEEARKYISNVAHIYDVKLNTIYSNDDNRISAKIFNPNSHILSITAQIKNNSDIIDSLIWITEETQINEPINVSEFPKGIYKISIITKDTKDTRTHTLPNILKFTNTGPIKIENYITHFGNNGLIIKDMTLVNMAKQKTIPNVKVSLLSEDSSITNISRSLSFGNLIPEERRTVGTPIIVSIKEIRNYKFVAEISSDDNVFWYDTIYYKSPVYFVENKKLPVGYTLEPNYPDPFNPTTTIIYSIPKPSHVKIEVYDILGRIVKSLVNEQQEAGYHKTEFSSLNLSLGSGIYFYRLSSGRYSETKKMVLMK